MDLKLKNSYHYIFNCPFNLYFIYPDINFHAYADDLQLYCNLPDPINNINTINKCINDISKWLSNNSLLLNSLKTKALLINTPPGHHSIPPIIINNHIIEYSNQAKNLGLTLDQKLSYLPHITNISKSINYTLHTIRLIRPSITTELAKLLVTSLILLLLYFKFTPSTYYQNAH